mmetsp:Transcript_21228/g.25040  ORF Transcript_21228/g.25040 Transcript_21228/m.25040 type:complete len:80 (-) Transcript_21228:218-457(-)
MILGRAVDNHTLSRPLDMHRVAKLLEAACKRTLPSSHIGAVVRIYNLLVLTKAFDDTSGDRDEPANGCKSLSCLWISSL